MTREELNAQIRIDGENYVYIVKLKNEKNTIERVIVYNMNDELVCYVPVSRDRRENIDIERITPMTDEEIQNIEYVKKKTPK